jgi:hypothetical protein
MTSRASTGVPRLVAAFRPDKEMHMRDRRDLVMQLGLAYLALVQLVIGVWGVADPQGWFRNFPGVGGSHWVAADPPYNHHLAVDAAAGFLAVGLILAIAILWSDRRVRQLVLIAYLAQGLPHVAFHALHPADALSTGDQVASTGGLAFGCIVAVLLLVAASRQPSRGVDERVRANGG